MALTHLFFPSNILAGSLEPASVNVAIPYADVQLGFWLMVAIADLKLNGTIVPGSAMASPLPCLNPPDARAFCQVQLQSVSGLEDVQFKIGGIFANTQSYLGTWELQLKAEILDLHFSVLSRSTLSFAIALTPVLLTVNVPHNATFWVDNNASTGGVIPVVLGRHFISLPRFVTINDTVRMRFDSWGDGFPQPNRTIFISSNENLSVVYCAQYRLFISTNAGGANVAGAGWYDNGSLASFSVTGTQTPTGGILDLLGAKLTFQGWFENEKLITTNSSGNVEMDGPHTIVAQWTTDYSTPIVLFTLVIAVGLGLYFMSKRVGRKTKKTPSRRRIGTQVSRANSRSKS